MAKFVSLGRVNCGASPVRLSATKVRCAKIIVSPVAGMTGNMVFGLAGIDKTVTTLTGVIKQFCPPIAASGQMDTFELNQSSGEGNDLNLADYWIDGAVSGEGLIVSYLVN